jgi:hypothetical protein
MQEHQQMHPDATFTMKINHLADRRIEVREYKSNIRKT